jgi:hypothetical protein
MTTGAAWIPIDPKVLRDYHTSRSGGVETVTAPSPYDLPDAVAVETDGGRNVVTIRFRYLEPERTDRVVIRKDITFHVGRFTQRLYAIEIAVNNVRKLDAVRRGFEDALEAIASHVPRTRKANFRAAREAVENSADELVRVAAAR